MYTVIDIETTGLSPQKEKITEIAIYVYDGEKIVDEFVSLVNPERPVPYFITRLTGITNEMLAGAPKFYEIAKKIVEITENRIFVAHNVDFDYNFIKEEFARLGYEFRRKKLCTVKLSKKIIPGHRSYSLGKLTADLGIGINGRHRAAGDAYATVQLFDYLLKKDAQSKPLIEEMAYHSVKGLHPQFDKKILDELPEKTGVYYFFDEKNELIYIGKSINIRKRVLQHLNNSKTDKAVKMRSSIVNISYELTGNELIALLLESDEIKKHKPLFNRAQRRSFFQYGIYSFIDDTGYLRFEVRKNTGEEMPLSSFTSLQSAKSHLTALVEHFELCQKLSGLYESTGACFHYGIKQCKGACIGEEQAESYNERAKQLIAKFEYESSNFLIIGDGRKPEEKSVVKIENGKYCGFGYFEPEITGDDLSLIAESIKPYHDNRDVQIIIKGFITNNKPEVLEF